MTLAQTALLKESLGGLALVVIGLSMALAGCEQQERKEKVFDLEAPGVDVEVEKSTNDEHGDGHGTVEIETRPPADE